MQILSIEKWKHALGMKIMIETILWKCQRLNTIFNNGLLTCLIKRQWDCWEKEICAEAILDRNTTRTNLWWSVIAVGHTGFILTAALTHTISAVCLCVSPSHGGHTFSRHDRPGFISPRYAKHAAQPIQFMFEPHSLSHNTPKLLQRMFLLTETVVPVLYVIHQWQINPCKSIHCHSQGGNGKLICLLILGHQQPLASKAWSLEWQNQPLFSCDQSIACESSISG
jgi:hypothetical protein